MLSLRSPAQDMTYTLQHDMRAEGEALAAADLFWQYLTGLDLLLESGEHERIKTKILILILPAQTHTHTSASDSSSRAFFASVVRHVREMKLCVSLRSIYSACLGKPAEWNSEKR